VRFQHFFDLTALSGQSIGNGAYGRYQTDAILPTCLFGSSRPSLAGNRMSLSISVKEAVLCRKAGPAAMDVDSRRPRTSGHVHVQDSKNVPRQDPHSSEMYCSTQ
jgi:hypothetical protein